MVIQLNAAMRLNATKPRSLQTNPSEYEREYITPFEVDSQLFTDLSSGYHVMRDLVDRAPVINIPVDSLIAFQHGVTKYRVNKYKKIDTDPIFVARINGGNYILDGTHRASSAWVNHKQNIEAHLVEFKNLDTKLRGKSLSEVKQILNKARVK